MMLGAFLEFLITRILARLFPDRFRLIPRVPDGVPLLRQFKLARWCYLQSFVNPEVATRFHVHRWRYMRSFVLSGWFIEERYPGGLFVRHRSASTYTMNDSVIHRLHAVAPRTWTLFFMLGKNRHKLRGGWGYFPRPAEIGYSAWDEAIPEDRRVKRFDAPDSTESAPPESQ